MPHEECVHLIKRAGSTLALKVVTASPLINSTTQPPTASTLISQSLPYRRKGSVFTPLLCQRQRCQETAAEREREQRKANTDLNGFV